eukprot:CAMPEP_0181114196 /NCGR_PEP_ID=MMETSP1071-20121207/20748_1 /TAXON_ID=35127 /ORGANISM="Thalassiosira sp., Strain NH16" /LENGTH=634 /DNA_ID=CAMNT_0023198277 /DNA_START=340 /DNA_END=2241 /DNA_ORIENTATION=-
MRILPGNLPMLVFALGSNTTDSFILSRCDLKQAGSSELNIKVSTQRQPLVFPVHSHCKNEVDAIHQDYQYTPCPTILAGCWLEEWNELCENVDRNMEGLVSPAPESFHVLHSVVSNINSEITCLDGRSSEGTVAVSYLDDLKALSSFLVKPRYVIELYLDCGSLKWRLIPRARDTKCEVVYPYSFIQDSEAELHHKHNTLELSRMALDLATKTSSPHTLTKVHGITRQAKKRLILTMGLDLRGPTSSDACFNFALAGVQCSCSLFRSLSHIGMHELKRTGLRSSFQPKLILQMAEKFAACDISGHHALDLYYAAGVCLEEKGYTDSMLIESLKNGSYGLHFPRPLLWLWRFSSRQRKVSIPERTFGHSAKRNINWAEIFNDTSNPLVVDVGSGMGASLLNLSVASVDHCIEDNSHPGFDELQIDWSECNYAGADLNHAMANFGNGIISRDTRKEGRVHFFCLSAEDFLRELLSYPGGVALIMINFPTPYSIGGVGNSQLPSKHSNEFMVTKNVIAMIAELLSVPDKKGRKGIFLFQTKCEDIAVHVKTELLSLSELECIPSRYPVKDIDRQYEKCGKRPKRLDEWLKHTPSPERAEGSEYSTTPILPTAGRPETEVQCDYEHTLVHRCLFQMTT